MFMQFEGGAVGSFQDLDRLLAAVPGDVVTDLRTVDTGAGRAGLDADTVPAVLQHLADRARAAAVTASCAVDGVVVPGGDAAAVLAGDDVALDSPALQVLAGYADAHDHLARTGPGTFDVALVRDVHRLLLRHTAVAGGRLRHVESVVVDGAAQGSPVKRYRPVPVADVPARLDDLAERYRDAQGAGRHHPVLLTGLLVLDLLALHPFPDANGRLARVLTTPLLQGAGYVVTRYVPLEPALARSGRAYSGALLDSTHDWHLAGHDPWPWLRHLVRALAGCTTQLARLTDAARRTPHKQDRVREHVLHHAARTFRIEDVRDALPGVSDPTIRLVLAQLRDERLVQADGVGRGATWSRRG